MSGRSAVDAAVAADVEAMGIQLWGVELISPETPTVRIYIEPRRGSAWMTVLR